MFLVVIDIISTKSFACRYVIRHNVNDKPCLLKKETSKANLIFFWSCTVYTSVVVSWVILNICVHSCDTGLLLQHCCGITGESLGELPLHAKINLTYVS